MEDSVELFAKASAFVTTSWTRWLTTAQRLRLYGFFKQAMCGDAPVKAPLAIDIIAAAKWDAWNEVRGLSRAEGRAGYLETLDEIRPRWRGASGSDFKRARELVGASWGRRFTTQQRLIL